MRLRNLQVKNFRCVEDSSEFSVCPVTCLVGKNGAGKTSILEALYKLNPDVRELSQFDVLMEYPRARRRQYQKRAEARPDDALITTWELEDKDVEELERELGRGVVKSRAVVIRKGYYPERRWSGAIADHGTIPLEREMTPIKEVKVRSKIPVEEQVPPAVAPDTVTETFPAGADSGGDGEPVDWDVEREEAIREVLDATAKEQGYSVNPPFERAREEAAVRFRASVAPEERHIWDNVEKDQLGRTILRDGNCFRVLNDPSAANRWAFENFDQYVVYCDFVFGKKEGRNLPWVEVIRERYPYLRDPVAIP